MVKQTEELIKKIEGLLRSKKKFQKWALNNYVKDYYTSQDIFFNRIKRPKGVTKDINLDTLLNFDAHYDYVGNSFTKIEKSWKINFLITNTCVRKVLKEILKELKKGGLNSSQP